MLRSRVYSVIFLNSLFFFFCAYVILFLVSRLSIAVSASTFSIPVRIFYYKVDYLIRSSEWSQDSITVVFATAPFLYFILGLLLLFVFIHVTYEKGLLRILLIWIIILSVITLIGEMITGAIMNQGFGYVIMYMFIMDTGRIVLTIFGGILLFLAGLAMCRLLMFTANSYFRNLRDIEKTKFVLYQYFFPYLAGIVILQLLELPVISWFPVFVRLCGIIFFVPLISRSLSMRDLYFAEKTPSSGVSWRAAFSALALLFLYRFAFSSGIRMIF